MKVKLKELGKYIKKLRLDRGLIQQVVADRAGYCQSHITQLENGQKKFSMESLERISKVLKVSVHISFY